MPGGARLRRSLPRLAARDSPGPCCSHSPLRPRTPSSGTGTSVTRWLSALAVVAAFLAATAYLFVYPREDSPRRADVVVVLAGSPGDRLPEGLELVRRHVAPVLYVSDGAREAKRGFCDRSRPFRVLC